MDTEAEYNFIKSADFYFTDVEDYYLGGTTNEQWTNRKFTDYIPNDSGKSIYHTKINDKLMLTLKTMGLLWF